MNHTMEEMEEIMREGYDYGYAGLNIDNMFTDADAGIEFWKNVGAD